MAIVINSLSFTGTTWLNLVLGTASNAAVIGPPDRLFRLVQSAHGSTDGDEPWCRVCGRACERWAQFASNVDPNENLYLQVARRFKCSHLVMNNPSPGPSLEQLDAPEIDRRDVFVVRDGRGSVASFIKYHPDATFDEACEGFLVPGAESLLQRSQGRDLYRFEDLLNRPKTTLPEIAERLGLVLPDDAHEYWKHDLHPIAGNAGAIAMRRIHCGQTPTGKHADDWFARYRRITEGSGSEHPEEPWHDWSDKQAQKFERIAGSANRRMGYSDPADVAVSAPPPTSFSNYVAEDSGDEQEKVVARVNAVNFHGYGPVCSAQPEKIVAGSLDDFRELLAGLREIPGVEFVSQRRLINEPLPPDRVRVSIRHDIDSDIVAAVQQAEVEREFGVEASWYVLHTAEYYGRFEGGVFKRHESMASIYRRIQDAGHDVGLHTDPLFVYQHHRIDGAQAVEEEIRWLRSIGVRVPGTVAHNSKPVYGAWNYEVFKGRYDPRERRSRDLVPDVVDRNGIVAPLRTLCEAELGLEYEANDAILPNAIPHMYGAIRAAQRWRWQPAEQERRRSGDRYASNFVEQGRILADCREAPLGSAIILVIHPCYYGARINETDAPVDGPSDETPSAGVRCSIGAATPERRFTAVVEVDQDEIPNSPVRTPASGETGLEIAFLGGENLHGLAAPARAQATVRASEVAADNGYEVPSVIKITDARARPHDALVRWRAATSHHRSDRIVFLGVDALELTEDAPAIRDVVDSFRLEGVETILILETAGERVDDPTESRTERTQPIRARFAELATSLEVEWIDPWSAFDASRIRGIPTHHHDPPVWNAHGQRLVGDAVVMKIGERLQRRTAPAIEAATNGAGSLVRWLTTSWSSAPLRWTLACSGIRVTPLAISGSNATGRRILDAARRIRRGLRRIT